ncbi:Hypothetical predicted protein, partial [Paramuricea clavata]
MSDDEKGKQNNSSEAAKGKEASPSQIPLQSDESDAATNVAGASRQNVPDDSLFVQDEFSAFPFKAPFATKSIAEI